MPRKILLLITDLEIGGTPTVVRELATRLHGADAQIEVACLKKLGPVGAEIAARGISVTAFDAASVAALPRIVRRLRRLIVERGIDTVFSFLVHANTVAAAASVRLSGVRFIQSIQTTQPRPRWHWGVQRIVQTAAERVVVPSPSAAKVAHDWADVPAERICVIPNAIDPDAFARSGAAPSHGDLFPVGFIGRLDPIKRLEDLIEAVSQIEDRAHLEIFGDGPEQKRFRMFGALTGCFTWHGSVSRPQEALAQIGMLVLPSEAEGFGLVLIEAMAAGVPVVATDVPGIRDVVQHEVTGLLVPVRRPDLLRAAIERVIDDEALRSRLIENGLAVVREKYAWEVVIGQHRRLLGI